MDHVQISEKFQSERLLFIGYHEKSSPGYTFCITHPVEKEVKMKQLRLKRHRNIKEESDLILLSCFFCIFTNFWPVPGPAWFFKSVTGNLSLVSTWTVSASQVPFPGQLIFPLLYFPQILLPCKMP